MKTFIKHEFPQLTRVDGSGGRTYLTPTGNKYPSVTSVVGLHSAKSIKQWREKVGAEEATKITTRAANRGTSIHSLCEQYLLGESVEPNWFDKPMFDTFKPHLDKIDNIHCLETKLYSDHLQVAGTVDCIAEYEGKRHVIDFKTSSKLKKKEHIHNYFMQTAAYAVMFEELTGIPVPKMIIIIGVDNEEPQVFVEKRNDWIDGFKDLRKQYFGYKGI